MWSRLASSPTEDMTGLAMGSRLASSPTEDMTERGQALPLPLLSFYKIRGLLIHRGYTHCPKKNLNLHIKKTNRYSWSGYNGIQLASGPEIWVQKPDIYCFHVEIQITVLMEECMTIVVSLLTEKKTKLRVIDDIKLVYGCKRNDCAVQLCNCKKSNPILSILLVVHE